MPKADLDTVAEVTEGAKSEVPHSVREHFFDVANARIAELLALGESQERIAERWGVSQNTVNKIKQRTGGLGVKALYGLRQDLRVSIDEILGLPPFAKIIPESLHQTPHPASVVRQRGEPGSK
jgi:hypothetical protein